MNLKFKPRDRLGVLVSLTFAILSLGQILLGGYIFALDMTFGPVAPAVVFEGLTASTWPFRSFIEFLYTFLDGWVVQKILLATLFFLLFYLPIRFYPFASRYGERYLVSIFFAINPFVYERLIAGQTNVLFGYLFLFPLVSSFISLVEQVTVRRGLVVAAWLLIIGVFSLHMQILGVAALLIGTAVCGIQMLFAQEGKRVLKLARALVVTAIAFLLVSCYWLIPAALTSGAERLESFTPAHWEAFNTSSDPMFGVEGNVLALYGFWGEEEPWSKQYVFPKELGAIWYIGLILLLVLVTTGIYSGLKDIRTQTISITLLCIGATAFIFSVGIESSIFGPFNRWLFENSEIWRGFRDSQKWSGLLALVYALFAGLAAAFVLGRIKKSYRRAVLVALCAIPIFYTPTLLFGAAGQLKPVWYPVEWEQANAILKEDPECKALFLPWQEYYSPRFTGYQLIANPSARFFNCEIVSGKNTELGEVRSPSGLPEDYYAIENAVTNNEGNSDDTIQVLKEQGIRYIIYTDDIESVDPYQYPFLTSGTLKEVFKAHGIIVYRLF